MSSQMTQVTGSCLCGKVAYSAQVKTGAGACHCRMCRKWSGGLYMSVHAQGKVDFTGTEYIQNFESSEWAERGFCTQCGSSLYYFLKPRPGVPDGETMLAAGTVDDQTDLTFDHEVYVDAAPGWYQFADEEARHRMTEADILAMYGPDAT